MPKFKEKVTGFIESMKGASYSNPEKAASNQADRNEDVRIKQLETDSYNREYQSLREKKAIQRGTERAQRKAGGFTARTSGVRAATGDFLGGLGDGANRMLNSGLFDFGGSSTLDSVSGITGLGRGSGNDTLKEVEILTGVSKRRPKTDPELGGVKQHGGNIVIHLGSGGRPFIQFTQVFVPAILVFVGISVIAWGWVKSVEEREFGYTII